MRRSVPLCTGHSGQKGQEGCQIKFNGVFTALAPVNRQALRCELVGPAIWISAVMLRNRAREGVKRRWIVTDIIRRPQLEAVRGFLQYPACQASPLAPHVLQAPPYRISTRLFTWVPGHAGCVGDFVRLGRGLINAQPQPY
jgi:hypothetical protein